METLLLMVVFIGLMYVLMVLPQKKKADAQKKMLGALQPGTRVLLNTGMFGTIRATGAQQMVVELAPGVEVTVLRQAVMRAATPTEEEFEYSDGAQAHGIEAAQDTFVADSAEHWQVDENTAPIEPAPQPAAGPEFEPAQPTTEQAEASAAGTIKPPAADEDRAQGR